MFKIQADRKTLCESCDAGIVTEAADNVVRAWCGQRGTPIRVPNMIEKCSSYKQKGEPSLYDLKEIAWMLITDKKGNKIGFKRLSEIRKEGGEEPHVMGV